MNRINLYLAILLWLVPHGLRADFVGNAAVYSGWQDQQASYWSLLRGNGSVSDHEIDHSLVYNLNLDIDLHPVTSDFAQSLSASQLYLETDRDQYSFVIGAKTYTWGETATFPILDIINPRDLTHRDGYYASSAKLPVLSASFRIVGDLESSSYNAQIILIPWMKDNIQPSEIAGFKVGEAAHAKSALPLEIAARFGLLTGSWDLNLYWFAHNSRVPTYVFVPISGPHDIESEVSKEMMWGLAASHAGDFLVTRLETAYQQGIAVPTIANKSERTNQLQSVLTLQSTTFETWALGLELHYDRYEDALGHLQEGALVESLSGEKSFFWSGVSINGATEDGKINVQGVAIKGLGHGDDLYSATGEVALTDSTTISLSGQRVKKGANSPKVLEDRSTKITLGLQTTY